MRGCRARMRRNKKGIQLTAELLFSSGYEFSVDIDGDTRNFHVGVVQRQGVVPTSVHFNEDTPPQRRTTFGVHLPMTHWKPAGEGGLEVVCRIAIGQALRDGFFRRCDHAEHEFDPDAEAWDGELRRLK